MWGLSVTGGGAGAGSENMIPIRSMRVDGPGTGRKSMFSTNSAATMSMRAEVTVGLMRAPSWATRAMVATSSPLAVNAALWALNEGGTAMDAAIASDAVLGLVQPQSTGVG